MFDKILIANRGEIAVRVIRACRELGVKSVAIYSAADRDALHVGLADEAIGCGEAPATESYLRGDAILEIARASGADALHPGYGFLSENADFAEACDSAGITFIGPPAPVIRVMGDKLASRKAMAAEGIGVVPGSESALDDAEAVRAATRAVVSPPVPEAAGAAAGGSTDPRSPVAGGEPIFDRETLLRRLDGRPERAKRLAALFIEEDGPEQLAALERAVAERDAEGIAAAAHALKGATGELSAAPDRAGRGSRHRCGPEPAAPVPAPARPAR